jgi:hypothetical protein
MWNRSIKQLGQQASDSYIVGMPYQCMAIKYDQPSPASSSSSSLGQITGFSTQGTKGYMFIKTQRAEPTIPVFDHLSTKKYRQ